MADHRLRLEWDQTSAICAAVFNAQRAPGAKPVSPHQFNPFYADEDPAKQRRANAVTMSLAQVEAFMKTGRLA